MATATGALDDPLKPITQGSSTAQVSTQQQPTFSQMQQQGYARPAAPPPTEQAANFGVKPPAPTAPAQSGYQSYGGPMMNQTQLQPQQPPPSGAQVPNPQQPQGAPPISMSDWMARQYFNYQGSPGFNYQQPQYQLPQFQQFSGQYQQTAPPVGGNANFSAPLGYGYQPFNAPPGSFGGGQQGVPPNPYGLQQFNNPNAFSPVEAGTQQQVLSGLQNPSAYTSQMALDTFNRLNQQLGQGYDVQRQQLNEEMAKRGLDASTVAVGRLGDLGANQARDQANLAQQLSTQAAQQFASDRANAIQQGLGYGAQSYGQGLGTFGANQGAQQQAFNQALAAGQFGLNAQNQYFNNAAQGYGLNLAGQNQAFNQGLQGAQFGLGQQAQNYGQNFQNAQFGAGQQQQAFENALSGLGYNNNLAQQGFQNQLQGGQQGFNNALQGYQANLGGNAQNYAQQQQLLNQLLGYQQQLYNNNYADQQQQMQMLGMV